MSSRYDLSGKVAIVTGSSSGLGLRMVQVLHAEGAQVVMAARRADRLQSEAESLGVGAFAFPCDVTSPIDRQALIDFAIGLDGHVDVLVNNAGMGDVSPAEAEPLEDFERVVDINLTSVFALSQLAGRHMLARERGSIVNIGSALGLVASAPINQAGYAATKGALVNLTRELACQWAHRGVRVNAIAPGWFPSEMTAEMFADSSGESYIRRNTPIRRPGRPDELDGALVFLASDASSYVIGHTLVVDGGWTAH
jgi:NAD(P)-dependent dehydrogenase (short-subunit alcohol dehydrogenase family)